MREPLDAARMQRTRGAGNTPILLGLSISLTGSFAHQGRQALHGLQLWTAEVNRASGLSLPAGRRVRLIHYDDASSTGTARANVERLVTDDRVQILFGPYSSGLTMAAARVAATHGRLLWNHGGTSDALFGQGCSHLVSVAGAASGYLQALPTVPRLTAPGVRRLAVLYDQRGTFATSIVGGLTVAAEGAGLTVNLVPFRSPLADPGRVLEDIFRDNPDGLVVVGRYQDDVALVRACRTVAVRPLALVAVAAGLHAFGRDLGPLAEGVIGPSQWEPGIGVRPALGPTAETFVAAFRATFGEAPEYPAAQAYALGLILGRCIEEAAGLDEARLRAVATGLDTTTLFGRFRLDAKTSRQVGHRGVLIQWEAGRKQIVWPPGDHQGD